MHVNYYYSVVSEGVKINTDVHEVENNFSNVGFMFETILTFLNEKSAKMVIR